MSDYNRQKQSDLLSQCICDDHTGELHKHEQKIAASEGTIRCLGRAVTIMAVLTGFALAGVSFSWVLLKDIAPYYSDRIIYFFELLGTASILSLLAFAVYWLTQRQELGNQREACRLHTLQLLAARVPAPPSADTGPDESAQRVA